MQIIVFCACLSIAVAAVGNNVNGGLAGSAGDVFVDVKAGGVVGGGRLVVARIIRVARVIGVAGIGGFVLARREYHAEGKDKRERHQKCNNSLFHINLLYRVLRG